MNIQPVSAFSIQNTPSFQSAKLNSTPACAAECPKTGEYKLPGYDLSFGMAKIKRSANHYATTLNYATRKNIEDRVKYMQTCYCNETPYTINSQIGRLEDFAKKCYNNQGFDGLRYLFQSIPNAETEKEVTFTLQAFRIALEISDIKKDNHLATTLLCHTKNQSGETVAQVLAKNLQNYQEKFIKNTILRNDALKYAFLTCENDDGQPVAAAVLGQITNPREAADVKGILNNMIYDLATQSAEISVEDSIRLLETNKDILDEYNKEALETLTSEDCEFYTQEELDTIEAEKKAAAGVTGEGE